MMNDTTPLTEREMIQHTKAILLRKKLKTHYHRIVGQYAMSLAESMLIDEGNELLLIWISVENMYAHYFGSDDYWKQILN